MHGGAITLAKRYHNLNFNPDLILVTDMLNLPVFQSLVKPECPVAIYFHENQFTYPWSPNDADVELQRDKHYGFINYSSALSADHVYFNSKFHFDSFFKIPKIDSTALAASLPLFGLLNFEPFGKSSDEDLNSAWPIFKAVIIPFPIGFL